jgi:hypothetical protein
MQITHICHYKNYVKQPTKFVYKLSNYIIIKSK